MNNFNYSIELKTENGGKDLNPARIYITINDITDTCDMHLSAIVEARSVLNEIYHAIYNPDDFSNMFDMEGIDLTHDLVFKVLGNVEIAIIEGVNSIIDEDIQGFFNYPFLKGN